MIRAIIVDDEPLALDVLENYIERVPELQLIGKCSNAIDANKLLQEEDVDLMFLDIQMPQLTGTDFLRTINDPPMVIFTTAYSNYAIEGFELEALDYLLKPISFERFMKAVNRAIEKKNTDKQATAHEGIGDKDFFFVKADKKLVKVKYDDILYIEGLKDYVIIRMDHDRVITLQTMKSLEEKLPADKFRRIHRSYIMALDKINAIVGNMVELTEKNKTKHLPIGKNYRDELLDMVNRNKL